MRGGLIRHQSFRRAEQSPSLFLPRLHCRPFHVRVEDAAMADGVSNKAIARRLGISFHTAKFHVAAILAKLNADSRTEAVARAAQLGLVML
jgi:FixJ family two-component response regulator